MKCKCKDCEVEIELTKEEAYHRIEMGVLCPDCYGRWISTEY